MAEQQYSQYSPRSSPLVLCLMGATATGKTDLAIRLRDEIPCDIISVDSALIYRNMDIGTAKPDGQALAKDPHRLVDIRDPAESYSAAEFCQDALREIQSIHEQGRIPLLVGGTMLYFKALLQGMADLPVSDPEIRSHLQEQSELLGLLSMHRRLEQVDPTAARRIHPNDPQRLLRALEVFEITGKPMTHFWDAQQSASGISLPFTPVSFCVEMDDRSELHERIAKRFRVMLELGFEEEVRRLYERGDLHKGLPSIRCVGYRQMWEYFDGDWRYDEMVERGIIATRQLAKRQMTWLRSWDRLSRFLSNDSKLVPNVLKLLDDYLI